MGIPRVRSFTLDVKPTAEYDIGLSVALPQGSCFYLPIRPSSTYQPLNLIAVFLLKYDVSQLCLIFVSSGC
jgi:hypothetical protein